MTETTPTISRKRRFKTRRDTDRRGADKETTPMGSENRELNIFISYATEDTKKLSGKKIDLFIGT